MSATDMTTTADLHFWNGREVITVPWAKQSDLELARQFHRMPCLRIGEDRHGPFNTFVTYTYLGSKLLPRKLMPKPLKLMLLLYT